MTMRILLPALFVFASTAFSFAQTTSPLGPQGKMPDYFHHPSHLIVDNEIAQRNNAGDVVPEKEEAFMREMSYYSQQRMISGLVLFNDSLSNYITKVAKLLLKDDTATFNRLHFYAYKSPAPNAYTSATGNILITVGLMAQLENEAQLAFILAHEITHYRQEHMLKGYLNREELKERSDKTPSYMLLSSYYSYNQEQELEADRLGFELYKKSPYSVKEALRSFDVLEYSYLPFDDIPFDTMFFNIDYMKIPVGYYLKDVAPTYSDDNYEDRGSTHPNVRKRRMALMTEVDSVKETGRRLFLVSKDEFLDVREMARYEICRLYLLDRAYPEAIYSSYMMLQRHPNEIYFKKIIGRSLYNLAAYNQESGGGYNPYMFFDMYGGGGSMGGRYSVLNRNGYYRVPDFKDYPGQQQQLFHLFHELEADELTVLALTYNWRLHKADPSDSLQAKLCNNLFSMLVNKQNLHYSYFSTITPDQAKEQLRQDSLQRAAETGEVGDSKYSRMDKFRLNSEKERFTKFAFVELLKDSDFVHQFRYYTDHRSSLVDRGDSRSWMGPRSKEERKQEEKDALAYGYGVSKVIVVGPDYEYYRQLERRGDPEQDYTASEDGQQQLSNVIVSEATAAGVECVLLSPFAMDSLDGDTFADLALLNQWFFERVQHGSHNYASTVHNQAEIDSIINRYGTRYVMFTMVESAKYRKIQRPVLYALSCIAVVPVVRAFIPRNTMSYDAAVLDLKTGEVIATDHERKRKGKEVDNTPAFYKEIFQKMKRPKRPKPAGSPVTEAERGM